MRFLNKTIRLKEWQLDIFSAFVLLGGIFAGVILAVAGLIPLINADVTNLITLTSDASFNTGSYASTNITGAGDGASVQLTPGGAGWLDPAWTYRRDITINNPNTSTLTEYQVLITLNTSNFNYANVQNDCDDIRFANNAGQLLSHYQLVCNTSGVSQFWVKVDSLAASSDTTIQVYFGNASATSGSNEVATFSYSSAKTVGYIINDRVNEASVISLIANNQIIHNSQTFNLNEYETNYFPLVNRSLPIQAKGLFNFKDPDTDNDTFVPVSFAGTNFRFTTRESGTDTEDFWMISPWGSATVTIAGDGGAACQTLTVTGTAAVNGSGCNLAAGITFKITSTIPILVFYDGNANQISPIMPVENGPWYGVPSRTLMISAADSGANTTYFRSDNANAYNNAIAANRDLTQATAYASYASGPALKITGDNPIFASAWNDGNGNDGVSFMPWNKLGTRFGGATVVDYIAIASPYPATCRVYNALTQTLVASGTASSLNSEVYMLGFGTGNSNTYVNGPWYVDCDKPVYLYAEMSADAETQVYTYEQMRQFVYPTPAMNSTLGNEEGSIPGSGTWESAGNQNAIDLKWNGGWGDGTGTSVGFEASVSNVGANANIAFQIRAASSLANLTSTSYQTLGVASSGTSFTVTKDELDTLGVPTGLNGRYIQIKATLNSIDGFINPVLESFGVRYQADNSGPSVNASGIQLFKSSTGGEVTTDNWLNNIAPYFSWSEGSDTQSEIGGFCLYIGNDINGDPAITEGILGDSGFSVPGADCPFQIETPYIDFATTAFRGSQWLESDTIKYYMKVKSIDRAGNEYLGTAASFSFYYDDTPPTTPFFISLPSGFVSSKEVTITWPTVGNERAKDDHSQLAGLQYRIGNNGVWYGDLHNGAENQTDLLVNDGHYVTIDPYDFDALSQEVNLIYFRSWDNAGNISTATVSGTIKINSNAPSSPQNLTVTPLTNTVNSYAFEWDPPSSYTGLLSGITYCYTVNTLPSAGTCIFTGPGVTNLAADAYANLPTTNTLYLVAKDEAGNINYSTYTQVDFTYTGTAPGIPRNIEVTDISIKDTANWRLSVTWEIPENIGAGVSSYKIYRSTQDLSCTNDIESFSLIDTIKGSTFYANTGLSQQTYYYCLRACDSANNCSAPSEVASGFPDGRFTSPAELISGPTITNLSTRRATINWVTVRGSDSKVAYGIAPDTYFEEEPSTSTQVNDHVINLSGLQPGTTYYYRAKWTDEDGNTGISPEKSFTTDPAPVIRDVSVARVGLDNAVIRFTARGAYGVQLRYGLTTSFGGAIEIDSSPVESTYTAIIENLQDGTNYFYTINPFDGEGFTYEGTVLNFATLPRPQITNVDIEEQKGNAQPTIKITWETNTPTNSIATYFPVTNPAFTRDQVDINLKDGKHEMTLAGLEAETTYNLIVKAVDAFGNQAQSDTISFTTATDSRPPEIFNLKVEGTITNFSESSTGSDQQKAQLIVSWDTDEPATSQVEFGQGSASVYTQKTQQDQNLTFNHLVVISNLTPSQVYSLRVISADSAGNEGLSDNSVTITPKVVSSALDLVFSNLLEIFGFLR